ALAPARIEAFARSVAARLGIAGVAPDGEGADPEWQPWVTAVARDLQAQRGRSLVMPGDHLPPFAHALAHAMNEALGNIGQTVTFIPPVQDRPMKDKHSLPELVEEMQRGAVGMLVILGGNPVFTAPADLNFA